VVRLPLLAESHKPRKPEGQAENGDAGGPRPKCRVLVADDNVDSAKSLTLLLSAMGHGVQTAYDGLGAVELAEGFRPDVILLDIGMPNMNGYEAARQIRRRPWGGGAVLVALTGWGQEEDKRQAAEAGFDHHFTKPVDLAALERLLASRAGEAAKAR
jgi:CheY-like chemotaxis protein